MNLVRRGWTTIAGLALVLLGIPMLVCPGPGLLTIGIGLALILTGSMRGIRHSSVSRDRRQYLIDAQYRVRGRTRAADTMAKRPAEDSHTTGD